MRKQQPLSEGRAISIPLSKLKPSKANARKTYPDLSELAASIQFHGLIQNLTVQKDGDSYQVVAGERRRRALLQLAKRRVIDRNTPINCRLALRTANATEVSLAENVVRENMHPVEQFEAFHRLTDEGMSVGDISARFGVSENVVEKRLSLARVSPKLRDLYRAGEMTIEQLQAFTLSQDHEQQEKIWEELPRFNRDAHAIRSRLRNGTVAGTDGRVKFVGLEAYEAAGGKVSRDLFSEGLHGVSLHDEAILDQLADQKLTQLSEQVSAEGWKWVDVARGTDGHKFWRYSRVAGVRGKLSRKEEGRLKKLQAEQSKIEERYDENVEGGELTPEDETRLTAIDTSIRGLEEKRQVVYPAKSKKRCGAALVLNNSGEPEILRGLVHPDDMPKPKAVKAKGKSKSDGEYEMASSYSGALVESLTSHKTLAIAAELAANSRVALAAVTYTLVLAEFSLDWALHGTRSALQVSRTTSPAYREKNTRGGEVMTAARQAWFDHLPKDPKQLWVFISKKEVPEMLELLAFCAAQTLNAVELRAGVMTERSEHAHELARALGMDMTKWFTPDAENFLNRVSRKEIMDALAEAGKEAHPDTVKVKKGELVQLAAEQLPGTGWLPVQLRIAGDAHEDKGLQIPEAEIAEKGPVGASIDAAERETADAQ